MTVPGAATTPTPDKTAPTAPKQRSLATAAKSKRVSLADTSSPEGSTSTSSSDGHSATWYVISGSSDYYWRTVAPCRVVNGRPCLVPEMGGYYAITEPNDDTEFPWTQDEDGFSAYPEHEGTAVWVRPDLARATHAKAMRELHGVRTVAETDDNYLSDPRHNIYMRSNGFGPQERLDHMKAVASMNAAAYSTSWLRDYYWRELRRQFGKKALPDQFVCRNHVLAEDWPTVDERDGPVRVGWMGSPSHLRDVNLAWPAMLWASKAGLETVMVGYDPTQPEGEVKSAKAKGAVEQWRKVGHSHVPWRQMNGWERMSLPFDIGVCPLETTEFTLGKSDVKFVEYTISGAATVASNMPVYNQTIVHGETGLLAGSPSEMIDHVRLLATDTALRERLVANAQQYVREERGDKQLCEEWGAVL